MTHGMLSHPVLFGSGTHFGYEPNALAN